MQNSKIEWTHHTFNPWWGCIRVSPGCEHCYAETLANRYGHAVWGPAKTTARREMSESYWKQPLKWNRDAERAGERKRVFCASMADVFEDHPQLDYWRMRLWDLIEQTQMLDWLLLTKRPENMTRMADNWAGGWPANVWAGTSVENQEYADKRIPELLKVLARVRFLSCEPLLGPVDLSRWLPDLSVPIDQGPYDGEAPIGAYDPLTREYYPDPVEIDIHWVICGGESGRSARPMHPNWARSLRDQCVEAEVPFLFKQWGEWLPMVCERDEEGVGHFVGADGRRLYIPDLLAHAHEIKDDRGIIRLGKKAAGRLLDGRTHDAYPA